MPTLSRAIKILGKIIITPLLLSSYVLLIAMTSDPLLGLIFVTIFGLYCWGIIWWFADIKARNQLDGFTHLLFVPFLILSGGFGLFLWIVFEPEERRRRWHRRHLS